MPRSRVVLSRLGFCGMQALFCRKGRNGAYRRRRAECKRCAARADFGINTGFKIINTQSKTQSVVLSWTALIFLFDFRQPGVRRKTVTDNAKCAKNSPAKRMRRAKRQAEPKILLNLCAEDQYFLLILPEVVFSNGSFLT